MWWTAMALAAPKPTYVGWYLESTGRPELAVRTAVDLLHAEPTDRGAHKLYAYALSQDLRDGDMVTRLYREWHASEPDSLAARLTLAHLLTWQGGRRMGEWCDEVEPLVAIELPEAPRDRLGVLTARRRLHQVCPGDLDADNEAIRALPHDLGGTVLTTVAMTDFDVEVAEAMVAEAKSTPATLNWYQWVMRGDKEGAGVPVAREGLVEVALQVADQDDPDVVEIWAASKLLAAAEHERSEEVAKRWKELDPDGAWWPVRRYEYDDGRFSWMQTEAGWASRLYDDAQLAHYRWPARKAVRHLLRLEDRVPDEGPLRAIWLEYLGKNYGWALGGKDGFDQLREAVDQEPADHHRTLVYAEAVATWKRDPADALALVDEALAHPTAWVPGSAEAVRDYDAWLAEQRELRAELHSVRGRLLEGSDAVAAARAAVAISPNGERHVRLGLLLAEQDDERALFHLGRGLALDPDDSVLERKARREGRKRFRAAAWGPDFDAWVEAQRPVAKEPEKPKEPHDSTKDYRVGQTFPDLELHLPDGTTTKLSSIEGVRVVDLWATWCGPCVASIPVIDEAARAFDGRARVFIVSVDSNRKAYEAFRKWGKHHEVAWTGRDGMDKAKVNGIPATFVIDGDGIVRAYHSGYAGKKDLRLLKAVEAVLAED